MSAKPHVVVLGAGFGGLEAAFYLRHALHDRVALTLVDERDHFVFRPGTIYVPFGSDPARYQLDLRPPTARKDIDLVVGRAESLDVAARRVRAGGRDVSYDYLIVATGADIRPAEIPGLAEHAITIWSLDEMTRLGVEYRRMVEIARGDGERQRLLFLVPPNNRCSSPLYEMAMMTDTWLRREKVRDLVDITWATYEQSYLQAFGTRLDTVVSDELAEHGIAGHRGWVVTSVEPGGAHFAGGERLPFDLLVSFPAHVGRERWDGLPADHRGFIEVDGQSHRVRGRDRELAVGDATGFPLKQAFLALLQGDAAAEHLAAEIESRPPRFDFEPMTMCVLEEMNRATFARVPMHYTTDPEQPLVVDDDDRAHYQVGVSPLWRLGKKGLGLALPWRFGHGEPFHAGLAWEAMDLSLRVLAKVLPSSA